MYGRYMHRGKRQLKINNNDNLKKKKNDKGSPIFYVF